MSQTLFEIENVTHEFGSLPALTKITLGIQAGERIALIGPSGAGKSTLLALLNGSLFPMQGSVKILGKETRTLSARALREVQSQIGTIHQQFHLIESLRVIHNVNAGHLGKWSFVKAVTSLIHPLEVETAQRALAQVGIAEKMLERTDSLSGGQLQRVALARVLVQNPIAILADEPISNLDPERGREIMELLRELCNAFDKTLVVSLHAIEFAQTHFQRVIGLRHGAVLFDVPAYRLTQDKIDSLYKI